MPSTTPPLQTFRAVVPSVLLSLGVFAAALPAEEPLAEPVGIATAAGLGLLFALLFGWALRRRNTVVACFVLTFAAAYAVGTGTAAVSGVRFLGMHAGPESVRMALWMLALFLVVVAVGTQPAAWVAERIFGRIVSRVEHNLGEKPAALALGAVLLVTFGVSLRTGAWTFYGGQVEAGREGSLRLEFMYDPMLLSAFIYLFHQLLESARKRGLIQNRVLLGALLGAVSVLLFLRQMRRMMLSAAIFAVLLVIEHPTVGERYLSSARRMVAALLLLAAVAFGVNFASLSFRESATEFATNDVGARLGDVSTRMANGGSERDTLESTRTRLNYLSLDALSVEYEPVLRHELNLEEMFVSTAVMLTPKVFYPQKYRHPHMVCEMAFVSVRVDEDLPCTAQAEGFLADGPWGVLLVALTWPPVLGLAAFFLRRRSALGIIAAMHLVSPFLIIEGSAFPLIFALRQTLLGLTATLLVGVVAKALTDRPAPSTARGLSRPQPHP